MVIRTYQVGADGKAPSYAKEGDRIVTGGGTYTVQADGTGKLFSKDITTSNFKGQYSGAPGSESYNKNIGVGSASNRNRNPGTNEPGFGNKGGGGGGISSGNQNNGYNAGYDQAMKEAERRAEEIRRQQEAAARAAVESGVRNLESNRLGINTGYEDLARQLYIERRQNERRLPQQLAAQGNTGGITESTNLGLQTAYQDLLAQGERSKIQELANLDTAIANLRTSGDLSIAQQGAQISQSALDNYLNLFGQMQNDRRWNTEMGWNQQQFYDTMGYNRDMANQQMDWQREQFHAGQGDNEYTRKYNLAMYLAQFGDFSGLKEMGVDTAMLENQWKQQQAAKGSGGGGYRSSGGAGGVNSLYGFTDGGGGNKGQNPVYRPALSTANDTLSSYQGNMYMTPGMGQGKGLDGVYGDLLQEFGGKSFSMQHGGSIDDVFKARAAAMGYKPAEIATFLARR